MEKRLTRVVLAALAVGLVARGARAAQINVELGGTNQTTPYVGQASLEGSLSVSTASDPWNLLTNYSSGSASQALSTTAGAATNVKVTVGAGPTPGFNQAAGSVANALLDNFAQSSTSYTVTITGLNPSSPYDLILYANNGYYNVANDANTLYANLPITAGTTLAATKQTSNTSIATSNNFNRAEDYVGYAAFTNGAITSTAAGTIAFQVNNEGTLSSNVLNGFQITGNFATVPEPASVAVFGLVALGLGARARRRAL